MAGQDLVVSNANIYSFDEGSGAGRRYGSMTISEGRVIRLDSSTRPIDDSNVQSYNAGGRTIIPGFIDPHNHLSLAATLPRSVDCSKRSVTSLDELLAAISEACDGATPGQWIRGAGLRADGLSENRYPTRQELDEVSADNPVFLIHQSCHMGVANSLALTKVGIGAHPKQPWGGHIEVDRFGRPTGVLYEAAINELHSASWNDLISRDTGTALELLASALADYARLGIVALGDALVTPDAHEVYLRANTSGVLLQHLQQLHGGEHFFSPPDLRPNTSTASRLLDGSHGALLPAAVKLFADQSQPDGPAVDELHDGCRIHTGRNFYGRDELTAMVQQAGELGIPTAIHAMGNGALEHALAAYQKAREVGTDGLLRIEHAFVAEAGQADRLHALDIDLVASPGLIKTVGGHFGSWRKPGQDHLIVMPLRTMIDAGVRVSIGSDAPAGPLNPLTNIAAAVTRYCATSDCLIDPSEAVNAADAVRMYTVNAAHAIGQHRDMGNLSVGKLANFVVLDTDILACNVDQIEQAAVVSTWIKGREIYRRTSAAGDRQQADRPLSQ